MHRRQFTAATTADTTPDTVIHMEMSAPVPLRAAAALQAAGPFLKMADHPSVRVLVTDFRAVRSDPGARVRSGLVAHRGMSVLVALRAPRDLVACRVVLESVAWRLAAAVSVAAWLAVAVASAVERQSVLEPQSAVAAASVAVEQQPAVVAVDARPAVAADVWPAAALTGNNPVLATRFSSQSELSPFG